MITKEELLKIIEDCLAKKRAIDDEVKLMYKSREKEAIKMAVRLENKSRELSRDVEKYRRLILFIERTSEEMLRIEIKRVRDELERLERNASNAHPDNLKNRNAYLRRTDYRKLKRALRDYLFLKGNSDKISS